MRQYNISVEDHFFFVKIAKGGSDDLVGPIMLRLVGRGLMLSLPLIHENELFKKALRIHTKKNSEQSSGGNTRTRSLKQGRQK